jgi:hypothetical protein
MATAHPLKELPEKFVEGCLFISLLKALQHFTTFPLFGNFLP